MNPSHIREIPITAGVVTVSSSRRKETDSSGKKIIELFGEVGIPVCHYELVPDRIDAIRSELILALKSATCVVVNGGTGLTHDDCTIEAVAPLLDKRIDGFGEIFRQKSMEEIGTAAILSRALGGVISGRAIFCIPGSTAAVTLAMTSLILPEIRHILSHAGR
jgi:molybdenum cofactor biosynthesis protein B